MFWTITAAAVFVAALISFLPLLKGKTFWQPAGLALIFLVPVASLWIYKSVGTPEAIDLTPAPRAANVTHTQELPDIDAMVSGLQIRLKENPEDVEGWMLLSRTYKSMQRYPEAVEALEKALEVAPDDPSVMVELAEAWVYVSPDGRIGDNSLSMLQRALVIDPGQQKALWLLGMAAAQQGEFEYAIEQWETLLASMEPGSDVASTVQSQIDQARQAMAAPAATAGIEPTASEPAASEPAVEQAASEVSTVAETVVATSAEDSSWQGTKLNITAGDALPAGLAAETVLYVMVRTPGVAMGPPIGVRRVIGPSLPMEITITDRDSMLKERMISSEAEIQLQARLSRSGSPAPAPGDWQSQKVTVGLLSNDPVELTLDQQVE